jgi:hypothetical protein
MPTPPISAGRGVASFLIKAVWPKLKRQLVGEAEERALHEVGREALASAVDQIAPPALDASGRQHLVSLLEQTLVPELDRAAAGGPAPEDPVEAIRQRFLVLGYDPNTIGVDFDQLVEAFFNELPRALRHAASRHGGVLFELITQERLTVIAEDLVRLRERLELLQPLVVGSGAQPLAAAQRRLAHLSGLAAEDAEVVLEQGEHGQELTVRLDEQLYVRRTIESEIHQRLDSAGPEPFRLLIVGEAGYGKTSLLWQLRRQYSAKANWECWLLKSSFLLGGRDGTRSAHLRWDELRSDLTLAAGAGRQAGQQPLVLLDTVDLLLHDEFDRSELRLFIEELSDIGCSLIATCRIREARWLDAAMGRPLHLLEYDEGELAGAVRGHVSRFYVDQLPREDNVRRIEEAVANGRPLTEVCRNPLTLRMLFTLYAPEEVPLEINVFQLYREYWAQRVVADRRAGSRPASGTTNLAATAMAVALVMLAEGTPEPSLAEVEATVELFGGEPGHLADLSTRGVLNQSGPERIQFFHQTFFEHAAGLAMVHRFGSGGLDALLRRTAERSTDLFASPVLEQSLLFASQIPPIRAQSEEALETLLDRSSLSATASALYVYAHRAAVPDQTHRRVLQVLGTDPMGAERFILVAPNMPTTRVEQMFECLKTLWGSGRWAEREHIIELLERLAARDATRTKAFIENQDCVAVSLRTPSTGIPAARKLIRPLLVLAQSDLEWAWRRLVELWIGGIDRARSRELQLRIVQALLQAAEASVLAADNVATRLEASIPSMDEDLGTGTASMVVAFGRLWALEWRSAGRSRDDVLAIVIIFRDTFTLKSKLNGLAEVALADSVEEAEHTFRFFAASDHIELRWLWARILLATLLSGVRPGEPLIEPGHGLAPATRWLRNLAAEAMDADDPEHGSASPGSPEPTVGRLVREGLRHAWMPRAQLLPILDQPGLQVPAPWLRDDLAGPFLVDGYLGGLQGAVAAMRVVMGASDEHPERLVRQLVGRLSNEDLTDDKVAGALIALTRDTLEVQQLLRALERFSGAAPQSLQARARDLEAIRRSLLASRSGAKRRTGVLLWQQLFRLGLAELVSHQELRELVGNEDDRIARRHLIELVGAGVRSGQYPATEVQETLRDLLDVPDPGTREVVLSVLTMATVKAAGEGELTADRAIMFATMAPLNGGRFIALAPLIRHSLEQDPEAAIELLGKLGRAMSSHQFGSRARSDIVRAFRPAVLEVVQAASAPGRGRMLARVREFEGSFGGLIIYAACQHDFEAVLPALDELLADPQVPDAVKGRIHRIKYLRERPAGGARWEALYRFGIPASRPAR